MARQDVMKKALLSGLAFGMMAPAAFANSKATLDAEFVPGELIVKLKQGQSISKVAKSANIDVIKNIKASSSSFYLVRTHNKSLQAARSELEALSEVEYAEPNFIYRAIVMDEDQQTNDPSFGQLWGLKNTGANEPGGATNGVAGADVDALRAWEITKGSRSIKVAVIDTGIDYNHPDLKDNMWINEAEANGKDGVDDDGNGYIDDVRGWDFANKDNDPYDGHSHGTHCAGTIGAVHNNGIGVAGVMSEVTLVPVKFLSDGGSGSTADAIEAINYATKLNVDIMSNSWGGGGFSEALKEAIEAASDAGIIFTAAAGNSTSNNDTSPHYPSNYDVANVVSVAAHTFADDLASFSSYGRRTVHIAAPGYKVLSTVKNGGYAVYSGTSMATPHVSGVLGLLLSKEGRMSHAEMRERLMATSMPIRSYRRKVISGGRVNAYNLLTDTRPARSEPNPSAWETVNLREAFESQHPYANNAKLSKQIKVEGAKYIRAKVSRYDLEVGYDFLKVSNASRAEVESISGQGSDYVTDYAEGDTLNLEFTSDSSVNGWGFKIESVEVVRE